MSFAEFWKECLLLARSERQKQIMQSLQNLYYDAWEEGKSPEEFMEEEWC